ncbi:MAG TPA: histone deacetylase family protein [Spirochaetota bacterium]|nr:histone deacetylase family protein [Spirochaetota bacterium]
MKVNVVFHEKYYNSEYAPDPAASPGRLESIMDIVHGSPDRYEIITPEPASDSDILLAHTKGHLRNVQSDPVLYECAALSAGGAIVSAETAFEGHPCFGVIRPPGHHASSDSCWGFCFFNNIGISLLKLFSEEKIRSAFVLDFDLHVGDGNIDILEDRDDGFEVTILNPMLDTGREYVAMVEEYLSILNDVDIIAVSAGFDNAVGDWGNVLSPGDYTALGYLVKKYSEKLCKGRRFALLEGGYNHDILGTNMDAFCRGFC